MNSIATCKKRLPLPELLVRLNLFERPPKPGNHRCPLHQERNGAAFGINFKHDSWVWNCHGKCSTGGDELTLLQHHYGLSIQNAIKRYADLCEVPPRSKSHTSHRKMSVHRPHHPPEPMPKLTLPPDLRTGSYDDCNTVARLRKVPTETTIAMSKAGLMGFASVAGFDSWLVLDDTRHLAEARRMDGLPYPASEKLAARKTHTLRGSQKNWPLGLTAGTGPILLVEGSGDFVAAHHFCSFTTRSDSAWNPVAMLGASLKQLHPDAAALFAGRKVRIVPHLDPAGSKAAAAWANLLGALNCKVDGFDLSRLTQASGDPVTDLNDATSLPAGDRDELRSLFV